jgi:hypothetical protein
MNRIPMKTIVAACALAFAGASLAQTSGITTAAGGSGSGSAVYLKRTDTRFSGFTGSPENTQSLATGLRDSKPVTLTDGVETVTFTPPTRPMGNGNVTRAMDLAQRDLAAAGFTDPTPAQIKIAMMGGDIVTTSGGTTTTTSFQGVLQLRSEGMGWGQIAHTIGVHPGMGKSTSVSVPAPTPHSAAGGSSASGAKSGIVTAAGGSSAAAGGNGRALGHTAKTSSVTTAAGASAGAGAGGVVTAKGGSGQGNGNAFGRSK